MRPFKKGDKVMRISDSTVLKQGGIYTVVSDEGKYHLKLEESPDNYYSREYFKLEKEVQFFKPGDEVVVECHTGGAFDSLYPERSYTIKWISDDGRYATVKGIVDIDGIWPTSLFQKPKAKRTEEKITIGVGTKVADITVQKEYITYRVKQDTAPAGMIKMDVLREMHRLYSRVYSYTGSSVPIQLVDRDAKILLFGCTDVDFRVSLNDIKRVLDIAEKLDD